MKSSRSQSSEYTAFRNVLGRVLQVSKAELDRRIAEEKIANVGKPKRGPKPKTSASGHVSSETD